MSLKKHYSITKNKINNLWDAIQDLKNSLKLTSNDYKKLYNEKQNLKAPLLIYDSDFFALPLSSFEGASSTTRGTVIPYLIDSTFAPNIDFDCPPDFLPFLKINVQYKTEPGVTISGMFKFIKSQWDGNLVDVRADAELVWHGLKPTGSGYSDYDSTLMFTQTQLDANQFLSTHAKKRFYGEVYYSLAGADYQFTFNGITNNRISLFYAKYNVTQPVATRDNFTDIDMREGDQSFATGPHRIKVLDASNINVIGTRTVHTWVETTENEVSLGNGSNTYFTSLLLANANDGSLSINSVTATGGAITVVSALNSTIVFNRTVLGSETLTVNYQAANETIIITNNTEITTAWATVNNFKFKLQSARLLKKIGLVFVIQSSGALTFDSSVTGLSVTSRTFLPTGRYNIFYDTTGRFLFAMDFFGNLLNLPSSQVTYPVTFSALTVTRNTGLSAPVSTNIEGFVPVDDDSNPGFILLEERTNGINTYRINPNYGIIVQLPVTKATTNNFNRWNDSYGLSGNAFIQTSTVRDTVNIPFYTAESNDIEVKVQIYIINPLVYFKQIKATNE